jgi:GDP-L-fucose synthase
MSARCPIKRYVMKKLIASVMSFLNRSTSRGTLLSMIMEAKAKIFIAGHRGMVGRAIVRQLFMQGYENLVLRPRIELDLLDQSSVALFFEREKPEYVILAAAKVGGIWANLSSKADYIFQNLVIQSNVIHSAYRFGASKLLFLGSSCIYPRMAPQPISETDLLTGPLEPTNDAYAIAKIAGLMMCKAYQEQYQARFISLMPTNLYGPCDNFDLQSSHVLAALIHRFHRAKVESLSKVELWGTGSPYREFLHVDDLAEACVYMMNHYEGNGWVNIGTGNDLRIRNLAQLIKEIVGYSGEIVWDRSKPDGTPRKLLNVALAQSLGWEAKISLEEGVRSTYAWFLENVWEKI